jgi:1,2-diacylglycerol 3-alpha-glucosyltransferase
MYGKLRILFTIECYLPVISGSGIATRNIASGLAERGHLVAVACPGKGLQTSESIEDGVIVYRLSSLPVLNYKDYTFSPFASKSIKKILNNFKPEIVNIQDHFFVSSAAAAEAKKRDVPVVGINYFHPENILHHSKIKKESVIYKFLERKFWDSFVKVFNSLDNVIACTQTSKKIMNDVGVCSPLFHIISNGIRLESFGSFKRMDEKDRHEEEQTIKNLRKKYGISGHSLVLISVCRLEKEKKVDVLIEALSMIKRELDFKFLIVGRGKEKPVLEKIVEEHDISGKVVFTGIESDKNISCLYKLSDIFMTGSQVELQGLSIMEAMASGLPVIASDSMAIPELVEDGVNGFLFEPGNSSQVSEKILTLAGSKDLRQKMGYNGVQAIKKHRFDHTLDQYEDLYRKVLDSFYFSGGKVS